MATRQELTEAEAIEVVCDAALDYVDTIFFLSDHATERQRIMDAVKLLRPDLVNDYWTPTQ